MKIKRYLLIKNIKGIEATRDTRVLGAFSTKKNLLEKYLELSRPDNHSILKERKTGNILAKRGSFFPSLEETEFFSEEIEIEITPNEIDNISQLLGAKKLFTVVGEFFNSYKKVRQEQIFKSFNTKDEALSYIATSLMGKQYENYEFEVVETAEIIN